MESSAIVRHNPQKYNKRVFPGSSSAYIEPEVIEVSPPSADQTSKSKARSLKRKEVVYHEIIDVDIDEDRNGVVFIEGKVQSNKKMKGSMGISQGPTNAQGSINSGQTTKKVDSNNKGKDIPMMSSTIGGIQMDSLGPADASNTATFYDLDDYIYEDDYSMALQLQSQFDNMDLPTGIEAQLPWFPDTFQMTKNNPDVQYPYPYPHATNTSKSLPFPQKIQHQNIPVNYIHSPQVVLPPHIPSMKVPYYPTTSSSFFQLPMNTGHGSHPVGVDPSFSMYHTGDISSDQVVSGSKTKSSSLTGSSSSMAKVVDDEDVLKRYESFKKFDTVVDFSDHFYGKQSSGMANPPKNWAKKIQDEWRILEKDLPDTIFVRAYESRMDLLRAVIIGAEGTPYHDGLFFFDVCFTSSYPNSPPLVHYHSGGLRINPNLYNCGKVCLSLLNTWTGGQKERWVPGTSTMLQVLVSIQGLILNTKPYFNEPGYAGTSGSVHGEKKSIQYNENTLILSLKTMVYTMRKPPKNFEDLVRGHFRNRVRDIMMACKAYTEGVQVGCLVRGGVQDLDEGSNAGCSDKFKGDVAVYVKSLVDAFKQIGAKEAEEFVWLTSRAPARAPSHAHAPAHGHGYPHISISAPALPPVLPPPTFSASVIPPTAYNHYW